MHADHARGTSLKVDLERAMRALSEAERAAIVQCYHNDLTHEEAAYVLGCPVGTVKTHVLRGKQKLKAALAAYARNHEQPTRQPRDDWLDDLLARDATRTSRTTASPRA